jgi:hypothetical protein
MLETVARAGFGGILIFRDGYDDDGAGIESVLRNALGVAPLVSDNSRLAFFSLTQYLNAGRTP